MSRKVRKRKYKKKWRNSKNFFRRTIRKTREQNIGSLVNMISTVTVNEKRGLKFVRTPS